MGKHTQKKVARATFFAFLAAALYALSSPISKLLLSAVSPTMMAAFLYLGAGIGVAGMGLFRRAVGRPGSEAKLAREDLAPTVAMVVLDIAAPICLMLGLSLTTAANAALLNNFEIVATSLIALLFFRERISPRLWGAIGLVTLASIILSFEDMSSLSFSAGSLWVLAACVCWGLENNCTRRLSAKDPLEIVVVKGFGSGLGALGIAFGCGERLPSVGAMIGALALGFVAYGLSIYFYIYAQRDLGAAKTSTYYAVAPFIGAALSLLIFAEWPGVAYLVALAIMAAGTYLASRDN